MGFEINPDELASSYGGKTAPSKPVAARVVPADQKEKNQGTLTTLEKQLAETLAKIESDTAKEASTKDLDFRKELTDRIERAKEDIPELKREIARAGGTPAPADAASAPTDAASASGAAPGFAIDPKLLQDSYPGGDKTEPSLSNAQIAAGIGAVAGAIYGARQNAKNAKQPEPIANDSLAARLMEKRMGLPAGTISAYEHRLYGLTNPQDIALDMAREINSAKPPAAPVATGALPVEPANAAVGPRVEPSFGSTRMAPSNAYMVSGEGPTQVYNYALSLGLSPTQAMQAVDNTKEEGGAHYIKSQARTGELKAQKMFPAGTTSLPEAPSIVVPVPAGGGPRPQAPSVWNRPRAIGPVPWSGSVPPLPLGNMDGERPGTAPAPAMPAAPAAPVEPAQQTPTDEQMRNKIRAASARAHMLQRGANVAVRGLFGAPLAAQAYNMATQEEPTDWTQWLSLFGGGLGTFGPLTSKIPRVAGRVPVAGTLATLAQVPYAVKHREEIARGMTLPDVVGDPIMLTGSEMFEKLPLFHIGDR